MKRPFIYAIFLTLALLAVPVSAEAKAQVVDKILVRQKDKVLRDGSAYKGDMMLMRPHGKGSCVYLDGTLYEGEFIHGRRHGRGGMTYKWR